MEETEISHFLHILVRMGEALQNSGAEVFRVEDTLNRIAIAYGAEDVNVFVITSSIVVTLTMPSLPPQTETRRLRHAASNDLLTLEKLNALSRRICTAPPSIEEFQRQLNAILAQHPDPRLHLAGSVLAASSFAIFFGGNLWDGLLAGGIAFAAVLVCVLFADPHTLRAVDYSLLLTFVAFFIFIGNLGRIPAFSGWLQEFLTGREVLVAVLASQVTSNVPAALLLSGFTAETQALIIGTNLGGLGTLIASMASLISYRQIARELPQGKKRYFGLFTLSNLIFLAILLGVWFLLR